MSDEFCLKPVINKRNNQLNVSIPKKQIPKELNEILRKDSSKVKNIKIKLEGWDLW